MVKAMLLVDFSYEAVYQVSEILGTGQVWLHN